jgi:fatty acid desaturase
MEESFSSSPHHDDSVQFVRQVHELVRDLLQPNLTVFWLDFLSSIVIGYVAFTIYLCAPDWSIVQFVTGIIAAFAMYRAAIFIHEIQHRPTASFQNFRIGWNILCGIPFFMPTFLYDDHVGHHSSHTYGTYRDAEYMSLLRYRTVRAFGLMVVSTLYPFLGPLRFAFGTPLAMISRSMDQFIWKYLSSLYNFNIYYVRLYNDDAQSVRRWIQEVAACVLVWTVILCVIVGIIPMILLIKAYFVFAIWMMINQLRTLTAHRYCRTGAPSTYGEQLLDSNTFDRGWFLPELWAPVGLRYHALHHLMPSMPYHAMGKAHRRLLKNLPTNSPYHQTRQPSLLASIWDSFFLGKRITSSRFV